MLLPNHQIISEAVEHNKGSERAILGPTLLFALGKFGKATNNYIEEGGEQDF